MGKNLIIKGADFSQNHIPITRVLTNFGYDIDEYFSIPYVSSVNNSINERYGFILTLTKVNCFFIKGNIEIQNNIKIKKKTLDMVNHTIISSSVVDTISTIPITENIMRIDFDSDIDIDPTTDVLVPLMTFRFETSNSLPNAYFLDLPSQTFETYKNAGNILFGYRYE